jgi:hypothetical protein
MFVCFCLFDEIRHKEKQILFTLPLSPSKPPRKKLKVKTTEYAHKLLFIKTALIKSSDRCYKIAHLVDPHQGVRCNIVTYMQNVICFVAVCRLDKSKVQAH